MSKKFIYTDKNSGDKGIDLIRALGGIVFVDPCPFPRYPSLKQLSRFFRKKSK